jgi:hypothetical protein
MMKIRKSLIIDLIGYVNRDFYCYSMVEKYWTLLGMWGCLCIGMREDTHVNILPSPKGFVLEMEHKRSGWTRWFERRQSGECSRSWPVALLPEDCWNCYFSLGLARWGVLFSEAGERIWPIPTNVFTPLIAAWCVCWLTVDRSCCCYWRSHCP